MHCREGAGGRAPSWGIREKQEVSSTRTATTSFWLHPNRAELPRICPIQICPMGIPMGIHLPHIYPHGDSFAPYKLRMDCHRRMLTPRIHVWVYKQTDLKKINPLKQLAQPVLNLGGGAGCWFPVESLFSADWCILKRKKKQPKQTQPTLNIVSFKNLPLVKSVRHFQLTKASLVRRIRL